MDNLALAVFGQLAATIPDDPEPDPSTICARCAGYGYVSKAPVLAPLSHPDFGRIVPCPECKGPEMEAAATARSLRNANIPGEFTRLDFDTYRASINPDLEACEWVEEFARHALAAKSGEAGSLMLVGGFGTRKTGLAVSAFRVMSQSSKFMPGTFVRTVDLFRQLEKAIGISKSGGVPEQEPAETIDYLCRVPLLVLDDLSAEKWTEYREEKLYEIIGARHSEQLTTIYTSNYGLARLGEFTGPRVLSRVIGMCGGNIIEIDGEDIRLAKAAAAVV